MQRGEVWWAQFDEQHLVILLSDDTTAGPSDNTNLDEGQSEIGFRAVQVVAASGVNIDGLGVEVIVGTGEGSRDRRGPAEW